MNSQSNHHLTCPQGTFHLIRYPITGNPTLQAWDGGDLLLLDHLTTLNLAQSCRVLIINDSFGALTCALSCALSRTLTNTLDSTNLAYYNDSLVAQKALVQNLTQNNLDPSQVTFLTLDQFLSDPGDYDLVLGKIPKHLSFFQMILKVLRTKVHAGSQIIFAAMTRNISRGVYDACTEFFGAYQTSLAAKKARLVFLPPIPKQTANQSSDHSPNQSSYHLPTQIEDLGIKERWNDYTLVKLPNTFAHKGIDKGSRLLVDNLPDLQGRMRILDIGCGNGFLSLAAAHTYTEAEIVGIDESALAVRSAQITFGSNFPHRKGRFYQQDGFALELEGDFDLILCNPPFHEQRALNRKLALGLILEASKYLSPEGLILVVANTSLGYQGVFQNYFHRLSIVNQQRGFDVIRLSGFRI
jgi:23S rRNA (guanine1835-N2)-methyltransferase